MGSAASLSAAISCFAKAKDASLACGQQDSGGGGGYDDGGHSRIRIAARIDQQTSTRMQSRQTADTFGRRERHTSSFAVSSAMVAFFFSPKNSSTNSIGRSGFSGRWCKATRHLAQASSTPPSSRYFLSSVRAEKLNAGLSHSHTVSCGAALPPTALRAT